MSYVTDQYRYCVYGEALVDRGLVVGYGTNGMGLVTWGLVWQGPDLWWDALGPINGSTLSTAWVNAAGSTITTTWTASSYLGYGEFPSTS